MLTQLEIEQAENLVPLKKVSPILCQILFSVRERRHVKPLSRDAHVPYVSVERVGHAGRWAADGDGLAL